MSVVGHSVVCAVRYVRVVRQGGSRACGVEADGCRGHESRCVWLDVAWPGSRPWAQWVCEPGAGKHTSATHHTRHKGVCCAAFATCAIGTSRQTRSTMPQYHTEVTQPTSRHHTRSQTPTWFMRECWEQPEVPHTRFTSGACLDTFRLLTTRYRGGPTRSRSRRSLWGEQI